MSLHQIRATAQRFETKTRRWKSVGAAAIILLLIANGVQSAWPGRDPLERTGDLLIVAACLYIAYEYRKHGRLVSMPEDLGRTSCFAFHRAQLARELNLARQSRRYLLPFVPGATLSLVGSVFQGLPMPRIIGVAVFGVALFLGVAWLNAHTARKLEREIDALDAS